VIQNVTRQTGGQWLQILLSPRVAIEGLELRPMLANLYVHEAQIVDNYGQTRNINNLTGVMIDRGYGVHSDYLRNMGVAAAINLRVESYGGFADLEVTTSSDQFTQLSLRNLLNYNLQ
jgi:hypothetical protein